MENRPISIGILLSYSSKSEKELQLAFTNLYQTKRNKYRNLIQQL
ncbi:hypothetical protein SAMN05444387_4245 [Flavobacterium pectinovorum]|uniref:Uncharacterized protein n=1 Tax=Flavobacterium pectinovorum TaxID=29533 RepID=A0ABY1J8N8_9FLAO|nr:hypothetical protein SAMN05444387_4245 [Flavobacterium pectinovorum]